MIVHLVPRSYPSIDGIGDYALHLAREFRKLEGWESRFVIGDAKWTGPEFYDGFKLSAVSRRSGEALCELLGKCSTLIVHYVCSGYHKRGIPLWFDRGLRLWKQGPGKQARVVVIFHELWASGPPWRSEFYLGWWQRILVNRMHAMSDLSVTSVKIMYDRLEKAAAGKTILLPIPSNLPQVAASARKSCQGISVIFFGQRGHRENSVRVHQMLLAALHAKGLLVKVRVVGKDAGSVEQPSADVAVLLEFLPASLITVASNVTLEEAAAHFLASDVFLSFYPAQFACKSGALMAALACGCVPVLRDGKDAWPLVPGEHFLMHNGLEKSMQQLISLFQCGTLPSIAAQGRAWYQAHADWPVIARSIAVHLYSSEGHGNLSTVDAGLLIK